MKKALVIGATGFIGSTLCELLVENGIRVNGLHRPTSDISFIQKLGIELHEGDVNDKGSLLSAMDGCDAVFHLAALFREAKHPDTEYWRVNLDGTRNVVEVVEKLRVPFFGFCSTTGVLGDIKNPPADETTPYAPLDVYQESKTEAEKFVLERFQNGSLSGTIIRPAMVYGPRDRRLFKLFKGVAERRLPVIGDGRTWCHWVLGRDVAKAFYLSAQSSLSNGKVYIVGGEKPITLKATMEIIADEYGVKLIPFRIPVAPLQIIGSVVEAVCVPLKIEPPIYRRRVDFFIKNRSFNCSAVSNDIGYRPTLSVEDEIRAVARWYKDNGWLKD